MNQNNSLLSTRDAAEASGFSLRHIQKLIKGGKLSASRDDGGNYMIDKSEFYRVFPSANTTRTLTNNDADGSRTVLENEIRHLQEMLAEKKRQNEILLNQLEASTTEKIMLLETLSSNQKLLEHRGRRKRLFGIF